MNDFLLSDTNDLQAINGDFMTGETTYQHQQLLLISNKGEWKEYPTCGVGITDYLLDESPVDMMRAVRIEFTKDGMQVNNISVGSQGQLLIAANYVS